MLSRMAAKFRAMPENALPQRTSWPELSAGVAVSANDKGLTILDTTSGRVFVGSEAAALMWSSASKGLSLGETADVLATRLGVRREEADRRVRLFMKLLEQNGLAVRVAVKR